MNSPRAAGGCYPTLRVACARRRGRCGSIHPIGESNPSRAFAPRSHASPIASVPPSRSKNSGCRMCVAFCAVVRIGARPSGAVSNPDSRSCTRPKACVSCTQRATAVLDPIMKPTAMTPCSVNPYGSRRLGRSHGAAAAATKNPSSPGSGSARRTYSSNSPVVSPRNAARSASSRTQRPRQGRSRRSVAERETATSMGKAKAWSPTVWVAGGFSITPCTQFRVRGTLKHSS